MRKSRQFFDNLVGIHNPVRGVLPAHLARFSAENFVDRFVRDALQPICRLQILIGFHHRVEIDSVEVQELIAAKQLLAKAGQRDQFVIARLAALLQCLQLAFDELAGEFEFL